MADMRYRANKIAVANGTDPVATNAVEKLPPNVSIETTLANMQKQIKELENRNKILEDKVKRESKDISEELRKTRRRYWFDINWRRNSDELFKFKFSTLLVDRIEKVVKSTETVGDIINDIDYRTNRRVVEHNIIITFIDWTTTEIDTIEYLKRKRLYEESVGDNDIIEREDWKYYIFRTERFGTFEINEKFIN